MIISSTCYKNYVSKKVSDIEWEYDTTLRGYKTLLSNIPEINKSLFSDPKFEFLQTFSDQGPMTYLNADTAWIKDKYLFQCEFKVLGDYLYINPYELLKSTRVGHRKVKFNYLSICIPQKELIINNLPTGHELRIIINNNSSGNGYYDLIYSNGRFLTREIKENGIELYRVAPADNLSSITLTNLYLPYMVTVEEIGGLEMSNITFIGRSGDKTYPVNVGVVDADPPEHDWTFDITDKQ